MRRAGRPQPRPAARSVDQQLRFRVRHGRRELRTGVRSGPLIRAQIALVMDPRHGKAASRGGRSPYVEI